MPNVDIYSLNYNILNIAMIDQMLINRNTDSLLSSLEHRTAVLPSYLFSISKIFDMIMIEKLKTYIDTCKAKSIMNNAEPNATAPDEPGKITAEVQSNKLKQLLGQIKNT